jgi:hypothetical protein
VRRSRAAGLRPHRPGRQAFEVRPGLQAHVACAQANCSVEEAIKGCIRRHRPLFRPILLDSSILSIVDHNAFGFRNGGLSNAGVGESVTKVRVESLSYREYSQAEDTMDQEDKG